MQELIKIESAPAKLGANFAEVKARLQAELAKFDVLITAETLADGKKLATELNQTAKAIDDRRKAEVAAVSEPIKAFDNQMKELVTLCQNGRQKLLDQIKTFEDETREKARELLEEELLVQWEVAGVNPDFRKANIDGLVMLTAITKTGSLAAKSVSAIKERVTADKSLQDRTDRRLLELENASYKAGLSAPLTRDHVAGFLMADDATYSAELERIIAAEIVREEEAQRRMREKLEREQREREEEERHEREAREAAEQARIKQEQAIAAEPEPEPQEQDAAPWEAPETTAAPEWIGVDMAAPEPEKLAPGKIRISVRATFEPEVPASASDEQITAALRATMERAGITTLVSIEIYRPEHMEAAE